MTSNEYAMNLMERAKKIEREGGSANATQLRELSRLRRAIRVAMLKASSPDACTLVEDLEDAATNLIENGRSSELVRTRRRIALFKLNPPMPSDVSPALIHATENLRQALVRMDSKGYLGAGKGVPQLRLASAR